MQNSTILLSQASSNTIQEINKDIKINLHSQLYKKIALIISAIALVAITSMVVINKIERKLAEKHFYLRFIAFGEIKNDDVVKLSKKKFDELNKFAKEELGIDLDTSPNCVKYINCYLNSRSKAYPLSSVLFDAKNNVNHPFHGKSISEITHIYSDENLFTTLEDCAPPECRWANSFVISNNALNNKMLDIAKQYYPDEPEVSLFLTENINSLTKNKKALRKKINKIGELGNYTYVASKKDDLKEYKKYIKKSITEKQ